MNAERTVKNRNKQKYLITEKMSTNVKYHSMIVKQHLTKTHYYAIMYLKLREDTRSLPKTVIKEKNYGKHFKDKRK